jgi:tricorn protease
MWIRAFLLASLCGSLLCSSVSQATIRFARFPAPSPDGKQVAFSWQGDLWLAPIAGGVAQRLTVHPAYDFAPIWSPDGKKIAFTSDRHGNDDVFVLHLDTGAVQRLTYFSGRDRAWGWTPDSRAVLFESRRESEPYGADFSAYVVPLDGGTPYRLHKASGSPFALSPDGRRVAFVRRDSAWWRKGYKGSAQGDLWLLERATNRYVRLTDTDTPDTLPMWGADGRTLYFVSERDGTANLYAMDIQTRRVRQLTRFKDDGVRFPQISANGAVITFEQGMDVYRLDTATGAMQVIPLQVPAQDARAAETVRRAFSANVDDYAIAPDGKEFVFAVRGELFAARFPDGGPSRNLTETVEPESDPQLSPDGKTLYFAAERDGTVQIYRLTSGDADEPRLRRARTLTIEPLTNAPQGASKPRLSPDGKLLAYQRGLGELVVRCTWRPSRSAPSPNRGIWALSHGRPTAAGSPLTATTRTTTRMCSSCACQSSRRLSPTPSRNRRSKSQQARATPLRTCPSSTISRATRATTSRRAGRRTGARWCSSPSARPMC